MQVKIQLSIRMGILLIFLFTSEEAHADFFIKSVNLNIHPRNEVQSGTNVSLSCKAEVSVSQGSYFNPTYIFYKDYKPLSTNLTGAADIYSLPDARVSHSGKYRCALVIQNQKKESSIKDLTVKGLQTPVLSVDKLAITEGDDVTAVCKAEGETGLLIFYFRDGSEELFHQSTINHQVEKKLSLRGTVNLFCYYSVNLGSTIALSNNSNVINVQIQELEIKPVIKVEPSTDVIEGDNISFSCTVDMLQQQNSELRIILVHGHTTLMNMTQKDYTMFAKANDSGEYECISKMGVIHKSSSVNITVKELFSVPILSINPVKVFEGDHFNISCQINSFASEKIQRNEIKFSIFRDDTPLINNDRYGDIAGNATNGKYMCKAEANGIIKESQSVLFQAKVLVSKPKITVDGPVIMGKSFWIHCHSENGSLPIIYTLKKNHLTLNWTKVFNLHDEARFLVMISTPADINSYWCEATNNGLVSTTYSERLHAPVIVPVGKPLLTVLPVPGNIEEGHDVTLICGIPKGSPPISFRFYSSNHTQLHTTTVQSNSSSYILRAVNRQHSGTYYCEAFNPAKDASNSDPITVIVSLAMWKKALIAAFCMLLIALLVLFFMMRYKAKRGKREMAAKLSVKPANPKSDGFLTLSLTHDTHYNTHTGGVNDKESVWSERPPDVDQESVGLPNEDDVEYTEVVHPQPVNPLRIPLRKGTDTVYSELQTSQGAPDNYQDIVEYAKLSLDQLPEPVD